MSKNFGQLKSALLSWLSIDQEDGDERLPEEIAGDLLNYAAKEHARTRESRFDEASTTITTVALTRDYTEPARLSKPRSFSYIHPVNGDVVYLERLNKDAFDAAYPWSRVYATGGPFVIAGTDISQVIGLPEAYTLWGGYVLFAKVPDRVLTIFVDYWALPVDLADAADTSNRTIYAEQYLLMSALAGASAFGIEDDRMPMWMSEAQRLERNLDLEDSRRRTTGRRSQSREPGGPR